jgi:hypothetical protein
MKEDEVGRTYAMHGVGRDVYRGRDHKEDLGVGGRITLRLTLGRQGSMGRTGFSWLRIGSSGELL